MINVWKYIEAGQFEQACSLVDAEYILTGDRTNFRNKIISLVHLKKYNEVIDLTNEMILFRNAEVEWDFLYSGMANWFLNRIDPAIDQWQKGEKCIYQDASGGISLFMLEYFAAIKTGNIKLRNYATKEIKKKLKRKQTLNWPRQLGFYLLDMISEDQLFSSVSAIPILLERNLCQANFVVAIKELEKGNIQHYKNRLRESVHHGPLAYLESMYYMAKGELDFLETSPAGASL